MENNKTKITPALKRRMRAKINYLSTHYNYKNRLSGYYSDGCGGRCFLGRFMSRGDLKIIRDNNWNGRSIEPVLNFFKLYGHKIPKRLSGFPIDFLCTLQAIHDSGSNWDNLGLNCSGSKMIKGLKEKYGL